MVVLGVIVMLVIGMHQQQQIAILVTGMVVVQIVTHQVALPGKEAMKEMVGGPVEVTIVMILGAVVDMAEVHV
jgi:hypothetical protein